MNAALSPVEKTPEVEEEGEVSSDDYTPLRKFSASEQSPFTPDDSGLIGARKRPSRWGRPVSDTNQRRHSSYQDYRSRPINRDKIGLVSLFFIYAPISFGINIYFSLRIKDHIPKLSSQETLYHLYVVSLKS